MTEAVTASTLPAIGFVGIGNMGWPMAARLQAAGFPLQVLDARPGLAQRFAAETGGRAASGLAALARDSALVITMLPTSAVVEQVLFSGGDCLAEGLSRGKVVVEMSSGLPGATQDFAARLGERGAAMVDAPVSGGVQRARTGELAIMVGGEPAAIEACLPALRAMGSTILRTGALGSGQAMKALNNLASAGGFLIAMEALLIGRRFGLDPAVMVDVLNASTGTNNSTQKKFKPFVLSGAYDSGFGLELMVKDLSTALQVARDTGTPSPFSALCRELWSAAAAALGPGADHTEMARFLQRLAGVSLEGEAPAPAGPAGSSAG